MDIDIVYKETAAIESDFDDVIGIFDENDVTYSLKKTPGTPPQAFLEWLIPTAVVVYVVGPFSKAYFETLGKRAGEFTANFISGLMKKCFGTDKKIDEKMVTVGGKIIESEFSRSLSFAFKTDKGASIRLLIRETTTEENLNLAFLQLMVLSKMYQDEPESCPLTPWVENNNITRNWDQLLCFNDVSQKIEFIDYVQSGKTKTLVTCPIDDAWDYQS